MAEAIDRPTDDQILEKFLWIYDQRPSVYQRTPVQAGPVTPRPGLRLVNHLRLLCLQIWQQQSVTGPAAHLPTLRVIVLESRLDVAEKFLKQKNKSSAKHSSNVNTDFHTKVRLHDAACARCEHSLRHAPTIDTLYHGRVPEMYDGTLQS